MNIQNQQHDNQIRGRFLYHNISPTEAVIRCYVGGLVGIMTIAYLAALPTLLPVTLGVIALFLLITGEVRWCPSRPMMTYLRKRKEIQR